MGRRTPSLDITPQERAALEAVTQRQTVAHRDHQRAAIVLRRADGLSQTATARELGVSRPVVIKWERRFREAGLAGLADAKGRGRKPSISQEVREQIIRGATQPPPNRSRWSVRSMARATGVSKDTVQRLWRANDIKPHVTRTFKLSNDPHFEAKFWDVIGLYLDPPERGLVLCCDEKSQCQALERTQPGFPVLRGPRRHPDPRLQAPRHRNLVRRAVVPRRQDSSARPQPGTPTGSGSTSCATSTAKRPTACACT